MTTQRFNISWLIMGFMFLATILLGWLLTEARNKELQSRERATFWEQLIQHTRQGIVVTDRAGKIVEWNAGATELFGWTYDEVRGHDVSILMADMATVEKHKKAMREDVAWDRLSIGLERQFRCWAMKKDGTLIPIHIRLTAVHNGYDYYVAYILPQTAVSAAHSEKKPSENAVRERNLQIPDRN